MADWSGGSNNGPQTTDHGHLLTQARAAFTARFGGEPTVVGSAPGRVELLGNHTDYNGGLVMAAAIDRYTIVVGRRSISREAIVNSVNFQQSDDFSLDEIEQTEAGAWTRYVRGVCWALGECAGPSPRASRRQSPAMFR
jgi:galactokinase